MSQNGDKLSDERYLTVMLRLLVDKSGTRVQGEVLDVTTKSKRKFLGWRDMVRAVRDLAVELPSDEV